MSEPTTAQKGIVAMEKADVQVGSTGLQLRNIDELFRFAQAVAGSALAPKDFIGKPESVVVAIQMGLEVGLPPMAALQNIAVINGRPSIWGDAQLAIVRSVRENGIRELEAFEETETNNEIEPLFRELCFEDDTSKRKDLKIKIAQMQAKMDKKAEDFGVSCFVRRRGFSEAFSRFTVADAKTANLWGKQGPWTQYPFRMLKARARSFLLRDQFGDALKGMMTREEAGDIIDITEVPRAEATPGPKGAPFRRNEKLTVVAEHVIVKDSTGETHKIPVPANTSHEDAKKIADAALEAIENQIAESKSGLAPGNVIDIKGEVAADPQPAAEKSNTADSAASESRPLNTPSPSSTEMAGPVSTPPAPKAAKTPFVLPPSRIAPDWLPVLDPLDPEGSRRSLMDILAGEEIHADELLKWTESRGLSKKGQGISDLAIGKVIGLVKQRAVWRKDILEARQ